jgi:ribosomal protein S18 acetylase RimI-like enzyme
MAAAPDRIAPQLLDIQDVRAADLDALLEEEIASWRAELHWDFRPSADLVRRFVQMQALSGYALEIGGEIAGYAYYVCEERKGLIGDLYVVRRHRSLDNERLLLASIVDTLGASPFVKRIESQLMMLGAAGRIGAIPRANRARVFPRVFMEAGVRVVGSLPRRDVSRRPIFEAWSERRQDDAARVIALAYQGHIDSQINDQYRSAGGARRFLLNIVQYPGCGAFFQPGSFLAFDPDTGEATGMCLASLVGEDTGHITQVCVVPAVRGSGIGYELLRRSIAALAQAGAQRVSLTVTAANQNAIALYESIGFEPRRTFSAIVWDGL